MAYTLKQLTMAWTAVHNGVAPDAAATASLNTLVNLGFSDANTLSAVLNSADDNTAVAVLTYQFFTGKSPTKAGLDYLLNSSVNPNDLSDPYYAKFNIENRYINFAANLGVNGEGAAAFAAKYGAMTFPDYVASIYETIIGSTFAKAAGVDVTAAINYLVGTKSAVLATVTSAGMVTPNMTPAQVDLAVKAAMAGLVMAAAIKADIGLYAGAADNFMLALATGQAVYNTDITQAYAPHKGAGSEGSGRAVDNAPTLPGAPEPPKEPDTPPASSLNLVLTTGLDRLAGDVLGDTFTATHLTFTAGDVLNGNGGGDILTITGATGGAYSLPSATVTGIGTAYISNTGGLTANTSSWTGLTQLNVTTAGATTVTARSTTDVGADVSNVGAGNTTILNGDDVTLNVTGATSGNIVLLGAMGNVTVTRAVTGAGNAGNITITDGADIDVTLTGNATGSTGSTRTMGTVFIDASNAAHTVKVKAPAPIADNGAHGALTGPTVTVRDANYTTTLAGTITTVEVDGFGGSGLGINGSALTTLKASHGTDIHIDNDDAVAAPVTALNLTLNDVHGDFKDEGVYQTLNVTHGATGSAIDLQMAALTALNVGGQGVLELTGLTAPNLTTVTVSGAAGLNGDLSAPTGLTSVSTLGTTGDSAVKINGSRTTFTGGTGVDTVTLSATTVSKSIALGGGDDVLVLAPGTLSFGATVDGGGGTADVLRVNAGTAVSGLLTGDHTGFERLEITDLFDTTLNINNMGDFHHVTLLSGTTGGGPLTLNGFDSGDTLVIAFAGAATLNYVLQGGFSAPNDTLNLVLEDKTGAALNFGQFKGAQVETLNITTLDGSATPTGVRESLVLDTTSTQEVVVAGNAGLTLRTINGSGLHTIDASGITLGGLALTLNAAAAAITITGSATANNSVVSSGGLASVITYTGGSGSDLVSLTATTKGGAIAMGGGDDILMLASGIGTLTATIDGEGGARDTVMMDATDAVTASGSSAFASKVVNFERLNLTNVSNQTIDVATLGFHYVIAQNGAGLTLNGMTSGDTLELSDGGTSYAVVIGADTASDTLNLIISDSAGAGPNFASGFETSGFETLNITTQDGQATPSGAVERLTLTGTDVKHVVATGNAGLRLTSNASHVLDSVDGSALTLNGLRLTLSDAASAITVKGSATAENSFGVTGGVLTNVTYTGGTGVDIVTVRAGAHSIDVGQDTAADIVIILAPGPTQADFTTITHLGVGDRVYYTAVIGNSTFGAAIDVSTAGSDLAQASDLAAASTTAVATWFRFQSDTYVVIDLSADTTFHDGVDMLIKLTGVYDLTSSNTTNGAGYFTL